LDEDSLFSDIPYEKGYALLDYIETLFKEVTNDIILGQESMRKMISSWIRENYYKSVVY